MRAIFRPGSRRWSGKARSSTVKVRCRRGEDCTFFGRPKKVPKKTAATSEARGTAKGLLAPLIPKEEGRGRAGLKNRQDTFFDAPPTRSRLTAPPIIFAEVAIFSRLVLFYGWFVGNGLDRSGSFAVTAHFPGGVGHPARDRMGTKNLRVSP